MAWPRPRRQDDQEAVSMTGQSMPDQGGPPETPFRIALVQAYEVAICARLRSADALSRAFATVPPSSFLGAPGATDHSTRRIDGAGSRDRLTSNLSNRDCR